MSYGIISRKDQEIITRALNLSAIDDESASMVLEAMIVKKDAEIRKLRDENSFIRDKLYEMEMEKKSHGD